MLTQEQKATIDRGRNDLLDCDPNDSDGEWAKAHAFSLLRILDSLPKEQPRQYTKAELLNIWHKVPDSDGYSDPFDGVVWVARHIRVLKE